MFCPFASRGKRWWHVHKDSIYAWSIPWKKTYKKYFPKTMKKIKIRLALPFDQYVDAQFSYFAPIGGDRLSDLLLTMNPSECIIANNDDYLMFIPVSSVIYIEEL